MADDRKIVDEALDYLVYAPVGAILTLVEDLPALAAKGRSRVQGQLTIARSVGQFAVAMGGRKVQNVVMSRRGAAPAAPASPEQPGKAGGAEAGEPAAASEAGWPARSAEPFEGASEGTAAAPRTGPVVFDVAAGDGRAASPTAVSSLAIPGYDSLAASQVVQRLAGLTAQELKAVEAYEKATRGRRTILGRIAQLSGGTAPVGPAPAGGGKAGKDGSAEAPGSVASGRRVSEHHDPSAT